MNVELDEVIVPSPELESSSSQKSVLVIPTPISEEVNDDEIKLLPNLVGQPEYVPHQSSRVILF